MTTTPELIAVLSAKATSVRRIGSPVWRSCIWLALAAFLLSVLFISHEVRPDFALHLTDEKFQLRLLASAMTGILSAIAAFMASVPGRSRLWVFLPLPAAVLWISTIGYQCLTNWVEIGPDGMSFGQTADCFATLVLICLPLSLTAWLMLRHTRYFNLPVVVYLAALAVSGISALAMTLFHALDASILILAFNFGTAAAFVTVGAAFSAAMRR